LEIAKICRLKNNKTLRRGIKVFEEIWNNIILKEKQAGKALVDSKKMQRDNLQSNESCDSDSSDDDDEDDNSEDDSDSSEDDSDDEMSDSDRHNDNKSISNQHNDIIANHTGKLNRFISLLGLDDRVYQAGKQILEHVESNNYLDKHNPLSRIASILFYVIERLNINIKKYQIIQTCQVSQVTIDKCYQKLMKYKVALNNINID
jgi:transcription initiation factor TFIIIB Brf1 subunit/transcription initiation factor TFIIB